MKTSFTRRANTIVDTICRVSRDPPGKPILEFNSAPTAQNELPNQADFENVSIFLSAVISLREPVFCLRARNASATFRPNLGLGSESLLTFAQAFQA